jgi:hypothetical protein
MAQSALTVTTPNPTPPTNMSCTGATPPNVPNYTKNTYLNWCGVGQDVSGSQRGVPLNTNPPPFFDDAAGGVGNGQTFAAATAALASGTGATSGGTENTYPGTGAAPGNFLGAVPASASASAEAAGTETLNTQSYSAQIYAPIPLTTLGVGPALPADAVGGRNLNPNQNHASSLSPATNPALTSVAAGGASGGGTATCTATGTNFTKQSVLNINGINYPTTFVSSTSLTAVAPKKATAGSLPVYVITGGVVQSGPQNWTFT